MKGVGYDASRIDSKYNTAIQLIRFFCDIQKGIKMECSNCSNEIDVDLSALECESNGSSGSHTTSYTYTGTVTCDECGAETEVTIVTDEENDTGEILSKEYM